MELADKLMNSNPGGATAFQPVKQQSEQYHKQLLDELANFGDAVMAGVDKENDYQAHYKKLSGSLQTMTAEEGAAGFQSLENILKDEYEQVLATQTGLPASLLDILTRQAGSL